MCKPTPNIQIAHEIFGINAMVYVDKSIKLIEKVPELLAITGFLKSFLIDEGYNINFESIKIKRKIPAIAQIPFK